MEVGGRILVLGGTDGSGLVSTTWALALEGFGWDPLPPLPVPGRAVISNGAWCNGAVIAGGSVPNGCTTAINWLDLAHGEWVPWPKLPVAASYQGLVLAGDG